MATAARRDTSKPEPNLTASRFREPDNHCAFIGEVQDAQDCFALLCFGERESRRIRSAARGSGRTDESGDGDSRVREAATTAGAAPRVSPTRTSSRDVDGYPPHRHRARGLCAPHVRPRGRANRCAAAHVAPLAVGRPPAVRGGRGAACGACWLLPPFATRIYGLLHEPRRLFKPAAAVPSPDAPSRGLAARGPGPCAGGYGTEPERERDLAPLPPPPHRHTGVESNYYDAYS